MTPLADQRSQFPILGRVALGYLTVNPQGKTHPVRSDTLVFTADDEDLLHQVAAELGGAVERSPAQDDAAEARWRVITGARALHIRLPSDDERSFSQWYERWGRGGIVRRCDGIQCQFAVVEAGAEPKRDVPCICKAEALPDEERCDPITRLNVVIEELFQVSRMGLWQITSRGWDSTREIAAAVELLRAGGRVLGIPLLLRVMSRTRRASDGRSYTFPIYTLVPLVSFEKAAELARERPQPLFGALTGAVPSSAPALPAPDPNTPLATEAVDRVPDAPSIAELIPEFADLDPEGMAAALSEEILQASSLKDLQAIARRINLVKQVLTDEQRGRLREDWLIRRGELEPAGAAPITPPRSAELPSPDTGINAVEWDALLASMAPDEFLATKAHPLLQEFWAAALRVQLNRIAGRVLARRFRKDLEQLSDEELRTLIRELSDAPERQTALLPGAGR